MVELQREYGISRKSISRVFKKKNIKISFKNAREGYIRTCRRKYGCDYATQNKNVKDKIKDTNLRKYGVSNYSKTKEYLNKKRDTCIKRYGIDSFNKTTKFIRKYKNTMVKKYGVKNYFQTKEFLIKSKKTKKEKYGDKNYTNRNKAKKTILMKYGVEHPMKKREIVEKSNLKKIKNNLKKYGVINVAQLDKVKEKKKKTCIRKYNVDYTFMIKKPTHISNIEKKFEEILKEKKIQYEKEYLINHNEKYRYDFKIGKILIELNPSICHNVNFGIKGSKPKTKKYHFEKTKYANDNGFKCICIWDWQFNDIEKILNAIIKGNYIINKRKIKRSYYGISIKKHFNKKPKNVANVVEIYDDGQDFVIKENTKCRK